MTRHIAAIFVENDLDHNKLINPDEFVGILDTLGVSLSERQAKKAFSDCDVAGKGEVDFDELVMWWGENQNEMRAAHHDETIYDAARDAQVRIQNVETAVDDLRRDMKEALRLVGAST